MMGGKLEQKKEEVIVDAELEKPAWMQGNSKNFTKEQIKEMKEFDAKLKVNNEVLTKFASDNYGPHKLDLISSLLYRQLRRKKRKNNVHKSLK